MAKQGGKVKDDIRTGYQGRVRVITEGQVIEGQGINEAHLVIESVRGTTVICHASQTSKTRGSITPASPHERAGWCMNQTNKLTPSNKKKTSALSNSQTTYNKATYALGAEGNGQISTTLPKNKTGFSLKLLSNTAPLPRIEG